jgi:pimeloyl-ACP methyl ester carboxylesterase
MHYPLKLTLAIIFTFAAVTVSLAPVEAITGPDQPVCGPGGSQYAHASVEDHNYGKGDLQYWLFEPAAPKPESAPVVIFNHGWGAMTPKGYRAWIDHIVRMGNIVIYPRYQASLRTKPSAMSSNAIAAVKDALQRLKTENGHVRPQLDKLAVVGHSAGGQISAGIAARAASSGIPPIKAVMCVEPGKSWAPKPRQIPLDDVSTMPATTLLLAVVGDRDNLVKDIDARRIINETIVIPAKNKNLVKIISDNHGNPPLVANHFCPSAPGGKSSGEPSAGEQNDTKDVGPLRQLITDRIGHHLQEQAGRQTSASNNVRGINALDYYCTWKLFDALEDAAFYGKNRDYAFGNTPQQRFMGKWSDGVPVKELVIQIGPDQAKVP